MEKRLQNNIVYFFIAVFIITLLGFYPTYFIHFPKFEGFTWAHHFHAFVATLWICMLITQAFLIRTKKYRIHRIVGKASYFVMPLLLFSFFLMARAVYHRGISVKHLSEADALAELIKSGLPDILFIGVLYSLGIIYKRKPSWHLRFLTCTGIIILGPGLGRYAFVNFPPQVAGIIMAIVFLLVPIVWLIIDIVKKKSPIPLSIFLGITIVAFLKESAGHSVWWQSFAKWIADTFF